MSGAPRIMTKISRVVTKQDKRIRRGTNSYIDDVIVGENIVSAEEQPFVKVWVNVKES